MPFCSWCLKDVKATVAVRGTFSRDLLRCPACKHRLVRCRACANYACWDSFTVRTPSQDAKPIVQHDQFCAEHRHVVRSFQSLNDRLKSPDDYRQVYDFRVTNLAKASSLAIFALGGLAIGGPLGYVAGPAIGGALGSAMGLSGAAATSAGLAAIGGGSIAAGGLGMAGGLAIIAVVGSAVGGALGAYVAGQYMSDVQGFDIRKVRDGRRPAIITVNGFLSERSEEHEGWMSGIKSRFPDREWFHVNWESKNLAELGTYLLSGAGSAVLQQTLKTAAKQAAKRAAKQISGPATVAQLLALSANPWHVALVKAEKTGMVLADILGRCDRRRFILLGHSLGCRVIYSCMQALATTNKEAIAGCYLFGGAVHSGSTNWHAAGRALSHRARIHNYHSSADLVLKYLYTVGTFFQSAPIGRHPIRDVSQVTNHDLGDEGIGHMDYKRRLRDILGTGRRR
jgi:hypothetical protein